MSAVDTDDSAGAVRRRLAPGRLLPLGGPEHGAWITERAASAVLRDAVGGMSGARLGPLRIGPAPASGDLPDTVAPPPPSALPPGPLRIEADCALWARAPLPETAEELRAALLSAADELLGLETAQVDLRVTGLLDDPTPETPATPRPAAGASPGPGRGTESGSPSEPPSAPGGDDGGDVGCVVTAVPGVARLAAALGALSRPVLVGGPDGAGRRHFRIQLAVAAGHRALDVALAVRTAVADASAGAVTVAVVVTAVDRS